MIQVGTSLLASDNSGMNIGKCIRIYGGFKKRYGYIGDKILISVKNLRLIRRVKKGELQQGIIVRTANWSYNIDGSGSKFKKNALLMISKQQKLLSSRIFGPFSRKLRTKKMVRNLLLSRQLLI